MKIGASYYPEVLPESDWEKDLKTVKEVGLSVLRCGEFAWSALFTPEGKPTLDWVTRFLDTAATNGFEVIWCTPSPTPPPYIFDRWPDLNAVSCEGVRMPVGIRRHYCPSHTGYLDLCAENAGALAEKLGPHPAIRGWQVDNEIAGDGFTCWCDRCRGTFQKWLEQRYGALENLNESWQTNVWSQIYTAWSQIQIPLHFRGSQTPALKLAWRRFRSDNWLNFYKRQADALRANGARCVTTNYYNLTWDLPFDRWKWRPHMDAMGVSNYQDEDLLNNALELAILNGAEPGDKPLWVLEQKAGQQASQNLLPDDLGRIARHISICAEAGAESGTYWHLRQHSAGCEMEHGAVLRHDGKATRIARAVSDAIKSSASKTASYAPPERLLVFSFNQFWANETRPFIGAAYDYRVAIEKYWFAAALELYGKIRIGDFPSAAQDRTLVLAPFFQLNEPGAEAAFTSALNNGATIITTADFLRLDNENNVRRIAPLAGLSPWVQVPEAEMFHLKITTSVQGEINGHAVTGSTFWAVPEIDEAGTSYRTIGSGTCEGYTGPLALDFPLQKGRLIVALTALDSAGVQALLHLI